MRKINHKPLSARKNRHTSLAVIKLVSVTAATLLLSGCVSDEDQLKAERKADLQSCEQVFEAIASTKDNFSGIGTDPRGMLMASWDFQADARSIDELTFNDQNIQKVAQKIATSMQQLATNVQEIDKLPGGSPERIRFYNEQVSGDHSELVGIQKQAAELRGIC